MICVYPFVDCFDPSPSFDGKWRPSFEQQRIEIRKFTQSLGWNIRKSTNGFLKNREVCSAPLNRWALQSIVSGFNPDNINVIAVWHMSALIPYCEESSVIGDDISELVAAQALYKFHILLARTKSIIKHPDLKSVKILDQDVQVFEYDEKYYIDKVEQQLIADIKRKKPNGWEKNSTQRDHANDIVLRYREGKSFQNISTNFNKRGIPTFGNGNQWYPSSVSKVFESFDDFVVE